MTEADYLSGDYPTVWAKGEAPPVRQTNSVAELSFGMVPNPNPGYIDPAKSSLLNKLDQMSVLTRQKRHNGVFVSSTSKTMDLHKWSSEMWAKYGKQITLQQAQLKHIKRINPLTKLKACCAKNGMGLSKI